MRLNDARAPRNKQPFADESRQALAGKVLNQEVHALVTGSDDQGRELVELVHRNRLVGEEMIRDGWAWPHVADRATAQAIMSVLLRNPQADTRVQEEDPPQQAPVEAKRLPDEQPEAAQPLIERLEDTRWQVRSAAADDLGELGSPQAVESLIACLADHHWQVRKAAATALGKVSDDRAVTPLITCLKDTSWRVRGAAAAALAKLGDDRAVEPLIACLDDVSADIRPAAAEALGSLGDDRAVAPLVAHLKDENSNVRKAAAGALGAVGDDRAIKPLIACLEDGNSDVREAATEALRKLGLDTWFTNVKITDDLKALALEAKEARRGFWADPTPPIPPWTFQREGPALERLAADDPKFSGGVFGCLTYLLWHVFRHLPSTGRWDWLYLVVLFVLSQRVLVLPFAWKAIHWDMKHHGDQTLAGKLPVQSITMCLGEAYVWLFSWLYFCLPPGVDFTAARALVGGQSVFFPDASWGLTWAAASVAMCAYVVLGIIFVGLLMEAQFPKAPTYIRPEHVLGGPLIIIVALVSLAGFASGHGQDTCGSANWAVAGPLIPILAITQLLTEAARRTFVRVLSKRRAVAGVAGVRL